MIFTWECNRPMNLLAEEQDIAADPEADLLIAADPFLGTSRNKSQTHINGQADILVSSWSLGGRFVGSSLILWVDFVRMPIFVRNIHYC